MNSKRKKIALQYKVSYDQATSLPLYTQNLIKAFDLLEESKKPFIVLVYNETAPIEDVKKLNYPYIKYIKEYNKSIISQRIVNRLGLIFLKKLIWIRNYWHPFYPKVDLSFAHLYFENPKYRLKTIWWIVDMQQAIYPDFFPKKEIEKFWEFMNNLVASNVTLMFSSRNSYHEFKNFYPNSKNPCSILPFASISGFIFKDSTSLQTEYKIGKTYFIAPNQFWPHKNHITILKAVKELAQQRDDFEVVFTGKTSSYRKENLFEELQRYILENQLQNNVKFLGFVDRDDLMNLISNSASIIQASLFEGWSTLVEEAKSLNKHILLSSLPIHREQIEKNCLFFDPFDYKSLAHYMNEVLNGKINIVQLDYQQNIKKFVNEISITFDLN